MKLFFASLVAVAIVGCPSVRPVNPPSDSPSSSCTSACTNLHAITACPEGDDITACAEVCTVSPGTEVGVVVDWDCIASAKTASDVQKCGVGLCAPK